MDADTLFRKTTIRMLARHFINGGRRGKVVGVVAGHVKVGNRNNFLTTGQSLEYLNGICIVRMAEMMVGAIGVVPGACAAWRRTALEQIGGFSEDTLAEDADAAMTLQRLRYAVLHENAAICDTGGPGNPCAPSQAAQALDVRQLPGAVEEPGDALPASLRVLGMFTMPYSIATLFLNLLFLPTLLVVTGVTLAQGNWKPVAVLAVAVLIMQTIIAIAAVTIARDRFWQHLLMVLIYRPIYEAMRIYLLYVSAYRVIKGAEFSWSKPGRRRNSVVAAEGHL